jgi:hypothetical protein
MDLTRPIDPAATKDNMIIMGIVEGIPLLKKLGESGAYKIRRKAEGYSIKVFPNPYNAERFIIVIQETDDSGLLYGVIDFNRWYINHLIKVYRGSSETIPTA